MQYFNQAVLACVCSIVLSMPLSASQDDTKKEDEKTQQEKDKKGNTPPASVKRPVVDNPDVLVKGGKFDDVSKKIDVNAINQISEHHKHTHSKVAQGVLAAPNTTLEDYQDAQGQDALSDTSIEALGMQIIDDTQLGEMSQQQSAEVLFHQAEKNVHQLSQLERELFSKSPDLTMIPPMMFDEKMQSMMEEANLTSLQGRSDPKYTDDPFAFIMISSSMPEYDLRALFASITSYYPDKAIFVAIQGAPPGQGQRLVYYLSSLLPEDHSFSLVIDPTLFKRFKVDRVPYFVFNTPNHGWRRLMGNVDVVEAYELSILHYETFEPIAQTFPVIEPNLLDQIEQAVAEFDGEAYSAEMKAKLLAEQPQRIFLPTSKDSYEYYVDPTIVFEKAVQYDETTYIPEGFTINPLEHVAMDKRYAVIDITDPAQRAVAQYWRQQYPAVVVISTTYPDVAFLREQVDALGRVTQADELLVRRLGLEKVPSLVSQAGRVLQLQVVGEADAAQFLTPAADKPEMQPVTLDTVLPNHSIQTEGQP